MGEHTALPKHACPACGAQAEWNPARQALVCPFCGTVAPAARNPDTGAIEEIDLVQALRDTPEEQRGWLVERRAVKCRACHAISTFEAGRVGQDCEFCGSTELVDYQEIKAPIRPQSLLPFKLDEAAVRERLRAWYASKWFAPSGLVRRGLVDTIRGVYIPYWTFDSQAQCPWTAQSGTYYYTTESYRDRSGRTRSRRVRHVRWRPASGEIEHFFDDHPVPGTHGLDVELLRRIEPFPTADLVPYDTAYLSGFVVEHYQVVLIEAAERAREGMDARLRELCADQVPGDTQRDLRIDPRYTGRTFKHILVPVWLLTYRYGSRAYRTLINGSTGTIAGTYPKSPWKIAGLCLLAAVLIAVAVLLAR